MKPINVRVERSGGYARLVWKDPFTGKRVRESTGFPDTIGKRQAKELADKKADELRADPALASGGTMTVAVWHKRYLSTSRVSQHTAADMQITFKLAEQFFGAATPIGELDVARGRDFVVWLEKREYRGEKIAAATVNKHVRYQKIAFERAVVEKAKTGLRENPLAHESCGTIEARKNWHTVTEAEMGRIFDKCPSTAWRVLFALCRYAGLRQQEAVRLRWSDIDFGPSPCITIHIQPDARGNARAKTTKEAHRLVMIEERLMKILVEAHERADPKDARPCEGIIQESSVVSTQARTICTKAGLNYRKPLHTLRKNLETEWFKKYPAPEVCAMLGHSMAVAMAHYFKPSLEEKTRKPMDRIAVD